MDQVKAVQVQLSDKITLCGTKAKEVAVDVKMRSMSAAKDPKVQATVASAAGGTVMMGAFGGAVGVVAGGAAGAAAGIPFMLFTFGLSVPISAALGGGLLGSVGLIAGGTAGCATGGASGYTVYVKREQISHFLSSAWTKIKTVSDSARARAYSTYTAAQARTVAVAERILSRGRSAFAAAKQNLSTLKNRSVQLAKEPQVQVSTVSATLGGVALGGAGGAVGLSTGAVVGGMVGVVPAVFTFGLSIPVFAFVGGGAGLLVGTTVGGATGAVGGGAVGYGAYEKRAEIRKGVNACTTFAKTKFDDAKALAGLKKEAVAKPVAEVAPVKKEVVASPAADVAPVKITAVLERPKVSPMVVPNPVVVR